MQERLEYTEPLTGTLGEAERSGQLGVPFSPLQRTWEVNPGAEAVDPEENRRPETNA